MNAEPISKELFEKLTKAGVTTMKLRFSGGSDEGYRDYISLEILYGILYFYNKLIGMIFQIKMI